ncbi:MAG: LamG-like jellyroll fold domain-containing protein [Verrucomicrobiota bacterium]
MKKALLLGLLLLGYAAAASTFPAFPAYDPFTSATASGGSSYAAGSLLAEQTNAMGQNWYGIATTITSAAANAITNTGYSLSYQGLPGFSGNEILFRNVAGEGARMFVATNASGFFVTGPLSVFYSMVLSVSNISSLSTVGDYCVGMSDQGTIADQTSQPGTVAARLYFKKNGSGYQLGISKQGGSTNYASTVYSTAQALFVVVDYEIVTTIATSGTRDNVRLWINPDPSTFGPQTQPTETVSILASDSDLTPYISAVNLHNRSTATPNDLYVTDFRMGTNWSWVTGGPAIGYPPVASTNCPTGVLNLSVTAMNNGTANGYQWQFNGANLTNGPSISGSGATASGSATASLTITGMDTSVAQRDSGAYTVVVTNAYGAVTSSVSAVTAYSAPVITAQPSPTNLLLYAGANYTNSLTAVGYAPLSYYWYTNNALDSAVTGSSFPIANALANASFYCVVSNSIGMATSAVVSLTVVSLPTFPYPLAVYNDHPIGYWPLNEVPDNGYGNDGTTAYDYVGGNNGFYTNAVLGQAGYAAGLTNEYGYSPPTDTNSSALFGSYSYSDSYVAQIPNINFAASQASSFSVEAWANGYISQLSGAGIVNKGYGNGGEQFTLDDYNGWRFYVRNTAGTVFSALSTNKTDGNWHHLVGVLDTVHSNITIYVDGVARTTTAYTPSTGILNSSYPVVIGSRMSGATTVFDDNFQGDIQDVAIYNYALTASQVANHYYAAGIGPSVAFPSSTIVNEGTTLTVPAAVTGSPVLAYQWYDVTSGTPGTPLAGQTNATLVISNISAAAYNYHSLDLTVTNLYGQASSSIYIQVVSGPPNSVTITPPSLAVYAGLPLPVPFTATAQGTQPFFYQWSTNGTPVPGATNAVYTNVPVLAGSYTIGCQVTNGVGSGPLAAASLTVVPAPTDYYGSTVLGSTPIAFWRLDEPANATTANDYVGGHNAAYNNAVNGQPGFRPITMPSETATVFGTNGITPSMAEENNNTANGIPLIDFSTQGANAEFSVETWIQELPQGGGIVEKGYPNDTQFALDGNGGANFRFVIHTSAASGTSIITANSGSVVPDGNWHHLVGVCDEANGKIYLYVDGSLESTASVPAGSGLLSLSSTYPVVIAAQESQGGSSFPGVTNAAMSQVALYAYAMTSNQVAAHYAAALEPLAVALPASIDVVAGVIGYLTPTVTGGVPPYSYQWQKSGTNISGATSSLFLLTSAGPAAAGSYDVIVSDSNYVAAVTSSVVSVTIVSDLTFNTTGPGWSSQGSTSWPGNNVLQLTDNINSEHNSAFYSFPLYIGAFQASFTYQCVTSPANSADGACFCIQNDPRGAAALGGSGSQLGVGTPNPITPSVELEFNIYANNTIGGVGISFGTNGSIGSVVSTAPLVINSGDPINTVLTYQNGVATVTLTDTNANTQYSASANVNIPAILGTNVAYVGFTASTGSSASTQQISDFTFLSRVNLAIQVSGNTATISWPAEVGGYVLQQNSSVATTNWVNVTNAVNLVNGQNQVVVPITNRALFYQLLLQ